MEGVSLLLSGLLHAWMRFLEHLLGDSAVWGVGVFVGVGADVCVDWGAFFCEEPGGVSAITDVWAFEYSFC